MRLASCAVAIVMVAMALTSAEADTADDLRAAAVARHLISRALAVGSDEVVPKQIARGRRRWVKSWRSPMPEPSGWLTG